MVVATTAGAARSSLLTTLAPGAEHCLVVRTLDGPQVSAWSDQSCVTVGTVAGDLLPDLIADPPDPGRQRMTIGDADFPELADRLLLKFDGQVTNVGTGPLHVAGNPQHADPADPTSHDVWQWVRGADGELRRLRPVPIEFQDDDDHNHFHLIEIMRYSLWDGNGSGAQAVTASTKVGFCLEDTETYPGFADPGPQTYVSSFTEFCQGGRPTAESLVMGVTEGWRDVYGWEANLQWIDVSDVAPGEYWIAIEANPNGIITESNEVNPLVFNPESTIVPGYEPVAGRGATAGTPLEMTLGVLRWDSLVTGAPSVGDAVFTIMEAPAHGTLDVAVGTAFADPVVTYTPDPGYVGTDAFVFSVRNASSSHPFTAPTATVAIDVTG